MKEDVIERTCKICNQKKLLKYFKKAKTCKFERSYSCNKCVNLKGKDYRKKYAKKNPDKIKAISLKWREQNREAEVKRLKEYATKNKNKKL